MSWATHNPEAYDKLQVSAIRKFLVNLYVEVWGFDQDNNLWSDIEEIVIPNIAHMLFHEAPGVADSILQEGGYKLIDESEYFDQFADVDPF